MSTSWKKVTIARDLKRPKALSYIDSLFDGFMEFKGDRLCGEDSAIIGGIAKFKGRSITVIGIQKGSTINENIKRNFGMPKPEGYRKALRLMKQAEKFKRPVIIFVDTPGAFCGVESEERGIGEAIAKNLMEMAKLKTPIISIFIGEGGSGGALALAVADEIWMLENSIFSILSPEGMASILYKDVSKAKDIADQMKITSSDLYKFNIVDRVIKEPEDGAEADFQRVIESLTINLKDALCRMDLEPIDYLLEKRYSKFRKIGSYNS